MKSYGNKCSPNKTFTIIKAINEFEYLDLVFIKDRTNEKHTKEIMQINNEIETVDIVLSSWP